MYLLRILCFASFATFLSCASSLEDESEVGHDAPTTVLDFLMKDDPALEAGNLAYKLQGKFLGKGFDVQKTIIQRARFRMVVEKQKRDGATAIEVAEEFVNHKDQNGTGLVLNPELSDVLGWDATTYQERWLSHAPDVPRTFNHLSSITLEGKGWMAILFFVEKEEELLGASRHPDVNLLYFDYPISQMERILYTLETSNSITVQFKTQEDRAWGTLI
ncbi:MAG: hypothetical protein ACPG31_13945, partial [Planctomycetota bacterium]